MNILPENNRFIDEVINKKEYDFLLSYPHYAYPVVIDIGANIGTFSMFIYEHAEKIYAIEALESNYTFLTKNIANNALERVKAYDLAIGGGSGKRYMKSNGDEPLKGGWYLAEDGIEVNCLSLREFMDKEGIYFADLMKMDVEGAEAEIVNAPDFPADRIRMIIGEYHGTIDLAPRLKSLGFQYIDLPNKHFIARKL